MGLCYGTYETRNETISVARGFEEEEAIWYMCAESRQEGGEKYKGGRGEGRYMKINHNKLFENIIVKPKYVYANDQFKRKKEDDNGLVLTTNKEK